MAESTEPLSAWIGQKVHLEYEAGDRTADASGTLEEVNDRGVFISEGETTYFYPWRNVVRIGSGHKPLRGRGTVRAREQFAQLSATRSRQG